MKDYCHRCGECCTNILITEKELEILREENPKLAVEPQEDGKFLIRECPFLRAISDITYCSVYAKRPTMCRLYHCGRIEKKDEKRDTIKDIRELMTKNPDYAKYITAMEEQAVKYGNEHGWSLRYRLK